MIHTLTAFGVRIAHWSTQTCNATQNDGQVESSVDDFVVERGTVSMRVALVLRSVEVYPPVPRFVWLLSGGPHKARAWTKHQSLPPPPPIPIPPVLGLLKTGRRGLCCPIGAWLGNTWHG